VNKTAASTAQLAKYII